MLFAEIVAVGAVVEDDARLDLACECRRGRQACRAAADDYGVNCRSHDDVQTGIWGAAEPQRCRKERWVGWGVEW
jgi:hypothetical protein